MKKDFTLDNSMEDKKEIPKEIRRFNLGAFLMPWAWAFAHRLWGWGFLFLVFFILKACSPLANSYFWRHAWNNWYWYPVSFYIRNTARFVENFPYISIPVWFLIAVIFGFVANRIVWRKGRILNLERFVRAQTRWAEAGLVYTILVVLFIVGQPNIRRRPPYSICKESLQMIQTGMNVIAADNPGAIGPYEFAKDPRKLCREMFGRSNCTAQDIEERVNYACFAPGRNAPWTIKDGIAVSKDFSSFTIRASVRDELRCGICVTESGMLPENRGECVPGAPPKCPKTKKQRNR